ncbi:unnamed protein product [Brassica oleracea]
MLLDLDRCFACDFLGRYGPVEVWWLCFSLMSLVTKSICGWFILWFELVSPA